MHPYARLSVLGLAALAQASAIPQRDDIIARDASTPLKFAALGDSFSAGIGAGTFYPSDPEQKDGANNNKCARMTGAYSVQLATFLPATFTPFDFISCSGDVLDNIDGQVATLAGQKYDVVALSISGNDFQFGAVVKACVYATKIIFGSTDKANQNCNAALNSAQSIINDESVWAKYVDKVNEIQQQILQTNGHIYITGYAKFFSPDGSNGDTCDNSCFINANAAIQKLICIIDMKWTTRMVMNNLVDQVNSRIQSDVIAKLDPSFQDRVHFINIDNAYGGKRFCEPGQPIWGAGEDDVWFFNIASEVEETGDWEGPVGNDQLIGPDIPDPSVVPSDPNFKGRGLTDKYQQSLVFHPKKVAHTSTAFLLGAQVIQNQFGPDDIVTGGNQFCMSFGPGGNDTCFLVPQGCVVLKPIDNTEPTVFCDDGTQGQLQSVNN